MEGLMKIIGQSVCSVATVLQARVCAVIIVIYLGTHRNCSFEHTDFEPGMSL
jgi:hypothetical protein